MEQLNDHSSRDHALLSASAASRWLACPPSAIAAEAYPSEATEYTIEGTLAHEVAEAITLGKEVTPREGIDFEMIECATGYSDYIESLITDDMDILLLEQKVDFSPWVPEGFGTCDCIIIQGDTLKVVDYKYGQGVAVSAVENAQLRLYALGALNDYGIALDVTNVEMHIYQPRIDNISVDTMAVKELIDWAENVVKPTAAKAFIGKGDYTPGIHCRFCPHGGKCKALHDDCTTAIMVHGTNYEIPTLAPHEVSEILKIEPVISLWLKKVREQAYKDMMSGVSIPGYKLVEGKPGNRKWVDEAKVIDALKREGYPSEKVTDTKLISPAQMEKTIGKKKTNELLADFITRPAGSPTIATESDHRAEFSSLAQAQADFE